MTIGIACPQPGGLWDAPQSDPSVLDASAIGGRLMATTSGTGNLTSFPTLGSMTSLAEALQSREWLRASGDIARALISDRQDELLQGIIHTARSVSRSDHCALLLPTPEGGMYVALADGAAAADYRGFVFAPGEGHLGSAVARGKSLLVEHISALASRSYPSQYVFGPAMVVPMVDMTGVRGAFLFLRDEGGSSFSSIDLELATNFATQVALGLELSDARTDAESLRVLRDRHRIAKDLHDNVMQRLFAAGLALQLIDLEALPDEVTQLLDNHMSTLDDTIRQIRSTIFELRESDDVDRISAAYLPAPGRAVAEGTPEEAQ